MATVPPPTNLTLRLDGSDTNALILDYTRSVWVGHSDHFYRFELYRQANGIWLQYDTSDYDSEQHSRLSERFTGLNRGYSYRARGKRCRNDDFTDCGNWSLWSSSILLPAPTATPQLTCGQPRNFRYSDFDTTDNSIIYRWDAPASSGLTITGYRTEWRETTGGTATSWHKRTAQPATARLETVGPFPSSIRGRTYQNRVYAVCDSILSNASNSTTFTYPALITPTPTPITPAPTPTVSIAASNLNPPLGEWVTMTANNSSGTITNYQWQRQFTWLPPSDPNHWKKWTRRQPVQRVFRQSVPSGIQNLPGHSHLLIGSHGDVCAHYHHLERGAINHFGQQSQPVTGGVSGDDGSCESALPHAFTSVAAAIRQLLG